MQSGIPETERERVRALRRRIADRIEADIALLDMLSGDPDLEPSLGSLDGTAMGALNVGYGLISDRWGWGSTDDREDENEHGGDIVDEPHEAEEDDDRDSGCGDFEGAVEQHGQRAGSWEVFA